MACLVMHFASIWLVRLQKSQNSRDLEREDEPENEDEDGEDVEGVDDPGRWKRAVEADKTEPDRERVLFSMFRSPVTTFCLSKVSMMEIVRITSSKS